MNPITALLVALGALTAVFVASWGSIIAKVRADRSAAGSPAGDARFPTPLAIGVGAVTNFFDTLGIGSFATTTAMFRAFKMVPDRIIPGTLNAGHTLPTVVQAFFYIAVIPVDVVTLISMIAAAVLGAWLGAGIVAGWPKRYVQIGMGFALLAAALFFTMTNLGLFPAGSDSMGVRGGLLVAAVAGQLPPRRADVAGDRPLRAVHDSGQPAGHERDHGISDHDGIVRVPDAGRQPEVHQGTRLQPARRARPRARRHSRGDRSRRRS